MSTRLVVLAGLLCCTLSFAADDADTVYKQGLDKLRESQADPAALVPATKLLAKAIELYEAAGDESHAVELNSCLYWARKKMTLADTQFIDAVPAVSKRVETAIKPVAVSEADGWLARADIMAKDHADDPLLVAVNYFEVADRFPSTDAGRKAFTLSLKALQKITAAKPTTAQIEIVFDEGWQVFLDGKSMQLTTPCTAVVPFGPHTITLAKEGFWDTPQRLDVRESRKLEFRKAAPGSSALLQKAVAGGAAKIAPGHVDLLAMFKPDRVYRGECSMKDGALICGQVNGAVEFPYEPPGEYDINITFTPQGGHNRPVISFPFGGKATFFWLMPIGTSLTTGKKYQAVVQIRKDKATVSLDGKALSSRPDQNPYWVAPSNGFALTSHESIIRYENVEIVGAAK